MITNILMSASIVAFAVATALATIDSMHFFQLNSYRFDTHTKWMRENTRKYLTHTTLSLLTLIFPLFKAPVQFKAIPLCILFAIAIVAEKPKKAKKPLVYTPRVKRMLFTELLLITVILGLVSIPAFKGTEPHETYFLMALALIYTCAPVLCLVANLINKPVELSVNQYYTNDAKKLLKKCPDLKIIGITGSYGKTSVKYYLNTLLRAKYNVLMTPESYNTPMGVVKTVRGSLKATHEIFVCEMGAKWVGDIKELCDIVHPHHGIITSIGPQHLESFKTLDAIKGTKFELADALPEGGMLFLNGDDENIDSYKGDRKHISYSLDNGDYSASDIAVSERGTTFKVKAPDGEIQEFSTKLIGRHNVLNGLAAFAVCFEEGVSPEGIKDAIEKFTGAGRRFEFLGEFNGFVLADDYAHHPTEIKATLNAAKNLSYKRVIAVFQPFTFSRTALLKDEFIEALSIADKVILTPIMGSREVNTYGIMSEHIAEKLEDAVIVDGFNNIADKIIEIAEDGDIVITMGGGDIYKAAYIVKEKLS